MPQSAHPTSPEAALGEQLYRTYFSEISAYLFQRVRHIELAQDLTQETFYRACRALSHINNLLQARPWLYRIAANLATDHMRRQQLIFWRSLEANNDDPSSEERFEERVCTADLISTALQQLPAGHRQVLLLACEEDYSNAEIADRLGIGRDAAKMRLARARHSFKHYYHILEAGTEAENALS